MNKKQSVIFISIFAISFILIVLFNYLVDPYNVFNGRLHSNKPFVYENMRAVLYPKMKFDYYSKPDVVFISSSNLYSSVLPENFYKISNGKKIQKIFMLGKTSSEDLSIAKAYLKLHPNTKDLYITLDFEHFIDLNNNFLPEFTGKNLNLHEFMTLFYSIQTTKYSLVTLKEYTLPLAYANLVYKARENSTLKEIPFIRDYRVSVSKSIRPRFIFTFFDHNKYNETCIDNIKELKKFADEKGVKTHFFVSPSHALTIANIYKSGYRDEFIRFKKELAQITDYVDFKYISPENTCPITIHGGYYSDPFHGKPELGNHVIQKMLNLDSATFGHEITKDNVDTIVAKEDAEILDYINKNSDEIKKYMSYTFEDLGYYESESYELETRQEFLDAQKRNEQFNF